MRAINMLIASLSLTAAMAAERHQEQGIELPVLSQEQSFALAGYFALAPALGSARLPSSVGLSSDDIFTFGGVTGIHFVLWEGNDSLHQIQWYVQDGEHFRRMGIKFTVSPPASEGMTLSEMLTDRQVTQQRTWIQDENVIREVSIHSNTDPREDALEPAQPGASPDASGAGEL